jgi:hypothetical protein
MSYRFTARTAQIKKMNDYSFKKSLSASISAVNCFAAPCALFLWNCKDKSIDRAANGGLDSPTRGPRDGQRSSRRPSRFISFMRGLETWSFLHENRFFPEGLPPLEFFQKELDFQ